MAIALALTIVCLGGVAFFAFRLNRYQIDIETKYNTSYAIADRYESLPKSCQVCSDCGGSPLDGSDCVPVCFNMPYTLLTFIEYPYWSSVTDGFETMNTTAIKICCYNPEDCTSTGEGIYPSTYRFQIYYDIRYPANWSLTIPKPIIEIVCLCVFACAAIFLVIVAIGLGLGCRCAKETSEQVQYAPLVTDQAGL